MLDIPHDMIGILQKIGQKVRVKLPAGLHAGVDASVVCEAQKCAGEFSLQHRFPAGERHTARIAVKRDIPHNIVQQRRVAPFCAAQAERLCGAGGKAGAAVGTAVAVKHMAGFGYFVAAARTHRGAGAAADAFDRIKAHLREGLIRLGVMAPDTAQGTALEKNGCANAGAVMQAKALYFADDPFHCDFTSA